MATTKIELDKALSARVQPSAQESDCEQERIVA